MTQNKNQNIKFVHTNNLYGFSISKSLSTGGFKYIDLKEFNPSKFSSNGSQIRSVYVKFICVLEVDLEYPEKF